ncbi:glycosyltransferase family 4 protein [Arthrobacter sp. NEB 688]|uniref:glycosyltransferase family 4 protein n=1 Tax=Arthrobacter sp. NEB 688 TaxID=904039 RepID=UPI00156388E9|nr:glycosyltransferase family 4 protein [Arthrobacter sp. NEB 688]QKE85690.1 glycosyltransferase family 4 protein [Arthrobacter sp. NEB 688]
MAGWTLVKVALLSDCYPPRLGGIERQVHDLAHELVRAGHEVEVFTATTGPAGERGGVIEIEDGVTVHRLAIPLPNGLPVNPFAPPEVRRRLLAGRFDVAHAHLGVVSPFATDLVRVALGVGLPVAATVHCVLGRWVPVMRAAGHLRRWAGRGVALSAVSRMAAAQVREAAGGARVGVLNNGIDAAWWAAGEAGAADRSGADGIHVVTAMRLVSRKRPLALLGALHEARRQLDPSVPLRATVAGEGPQRRAMEAYVRARDLDWVSMPGRLDREGLRRMHHAGDLYVTTARLEAFGIAALEARAAGLPVVAPAGTGVDDVVEDGVDGLLVSSDAGVAEAVARLAGDDALRRRMRAHLRQDPPRQDWPATVAATLDEYRRAGAR